MSYSAHPAGSFRSLLTRAWRGRLLRAALLTSGIALLLFSSVFLLTVERNATTAPSVAALPVEPLGPGIGAMPQDEDQRPPDALSGGQEGTLDAGAALAGVDAKALYDGLIRLVVALQPTPTLTPRPTPTLTPAPTPEVEQPAAPPEQVAAPREEPVAPPAAPRDPTPTPQPPPSPPACPTASMSAFAQALFDAINNERTQQELPALALHGCVVYVAQLRSQDMASGGYFAHTSPEGDTAFSLMDQYGVPYGWAGENLARNNYPDDQSVGVAIRDLMASDGHRANILSGNYTHLGVGAVDDGAGMKYYTMIFIGPP